MSRRYQFRTTNELIPCTLEQVQSLFQAFRANQSSSLLFESLSQIERLPVSATLCFHPIFRFEVQAFHDYFELKISSEGSLAYLGHTEIERFPRSAGTPVFAQIFKCIQKRLSGSSPELRMYGFTTYEARELCESAVRGLHGKEGMLLFRYQVFADVLIVSQQSARLSQTFLSTPNHETYQRFRECTSESLKGTFRVSDEVISSLSAKQHALAFSEAQRYLKRGDVFQLVLSRRDQYRCSGDSFLLYNRLRQIEPSPFHYFLDYRDFRIGGASPELHLRLEQSTARIDPIAGTCTPGHEQALLCNAKELAEHTMLVDLARNDLSRYCRHVLAKEIATIQRFARVSHLTSRIEGQLKEPSTGFELFAGTFPAGTLTGAPKIKAMELIDHLETVARGFYGGAVGFFTLDGQSEHAIMIRSFEEKVGLLSIQAGSGIILGSQAAMEYLEIEKKLAALTDCIREFSTARDATVEAACNGY